jgi:hypothetical protein
MTPTTRLMTRLREAGRLLALDLFALEARLLLALGLGRPPLIRVRH